MNAVKWNGMMISCLFSVRLNQEKRAATSVVFVPEKTPADFSISLVSVLVMKLNMFMLQLKFESSTNYFYITMDQVTVCNIKVVTRSDELNYQPMLQFSRLQSFSAHLSALFWFLSQEIPSSPDKPIVHYMPSTKWQTKLATSW